MSSLGPYVSGTGPSQATHADAPDKEGTSHRQTDKAIADVQVNTYGKRGGKTVR
jgi:hypothetical protein